MMFWCGPLHRRALEIDERLLGPDHPDVATDLYNLAFVVHQEYYKDDRIQPLYKRALAIYEKAWGRELVPVECLYGLAGVYKLQSRYAEAEPLYQRVIVMYEKMMANSPHPIAQLGLANSLRRLASLYQAAQRDEEAEILEKRARHIERHGTIPSERQELAVPMADCPADMSDRETYVQYSCVSHWWQAPVQYN